MESETKEYLDHLKELYNVLYRCWRAGYDFSKTREEVHSIFGESMFQDAEIKDRLRFITWRREFPRQV